MKKILIILGSLLFVGSPASIVVACGDNGDHLNKKGNSCWAYLPALKNGGSPDSADVWREMAPFSDNASDPSNPETWDGATKGRIAIQILKMLNVSILANADTLFDKLKYKTGNTNYQKLVTILAQDWKNLKNNVTYEITNKKQSYKDQYGKSWEKHWKDMLKDDYDSSENNYRAYLMTSSSNDNATTELTNSLIGNYDLEYNTISAPTIRTQWDTDFAHLTDPTWQKGKEPLVRNIALSFTPRYDVTTNKLDPNWAKDDLQALTFTDVQTMITNLFAKYKNKSDWPQNITVPKRILNGDNTFVLPSKTDPKSDNNYSIGTLSQFQQFFAKQWYSYYKPLAISDMTFKYSTYKDPDGNTGINRGLVDDKTGKPTANLFDTETQKNINKFLTDINGADIKWSDFNDNRLGTTPTYEKKCLTFSSSGSPFNANLLASVYGSIDNLAKKTALKANPTSLNDLLVKIPRAKTDSMFTVLNVGKNLTTTSDRIVAYFDDTALHLIHVDGLSNYVSNPVFTGTYNEIHDLNNFNYMQSIDKYDFTPQQITSGLSFNNSTQNNYLQYLENQSALDGHANVKPTFNILQAIKSYATLDNNSTIGNNTWYTCFYNFFTDLFTNKIQTPDDHWLNKVITFYKNGKPVSASDPLPTWFNQTIANNDSSLRLNPLNSLITTLQKENTTIEGKPTDNNHYPNGEYWKDQIRKIFNEFILNNNAAGQIWGNLD